jgi:tetratricopeptide (TPR) repeat protein
LPETPERIAKYRELSARIDALFDLGNDEEGERLLSATIEESERDEAYNRFFRGEAAGYLQKDYPQQKEHLAEANRLRPNDYFLARNMGVCLILLDKEKEAIGWLRSALACNASDYASMRYMGLALSNQRKEQEAIEWYRKALAVHPADYDSMRQIGISLAKEKKDDEAVAWYQQALAVNGNDYDSMRQLGVSLATMGEYEEAIDWFNKALTVNAGDADARRNLKIVLELHAEANGELGAGRKFQRGVTRTLERFGAWLQSFVTSKKRGL